MDKKASQEKCILTDTMYNAIEMVIIINEKDWIRIYKKFFKVRLTQRKEVVALWNTTILFVFTLW